MFLKNAVSQLKMNTEESFVLASLKEFVKLWGSSREATFNLECRNGQAWFQLGASLGPPSFPHFCPTPKTPKRKKISTARIEKDRARAAVHRSQKPENSVVSTVSGSSAQFLPSAIENPSPSFIFHTKSATQGEP